MAKFNFGNVLGGAVFGGLNAILQHNASRDGYSKANRYEVVVGLPGGTNNAEAGDSAQSGNLLSQLHGETARRISFRCDSISGRRNLRTVMNGNIYGPPHEMVQGQTFGEVVATFYMGSDMAERYFFEEWQKVSYNPDTYNINYYKEYVGAIEIYALNEKMKEQWAFVLKSVFKNN